jgi:hypothetical protein
MQSRFAMLAGGALLTTGLGLAPATAPQKAASVSMVVYKSQT